MSNPDSATFDIRHSTFDVFAVNIDTAHPAGSSGMIDAILALAYDPAAFDVSAADVHMGTVSESGAGWRLQAEVNSEKGLIGVELVGNNPVLSTAGGSLITVTMHPKSALANTFRTDSSLPPLRFVPSADPSGGVRVYQTQISDAKGAFVLEQIVESGPLQTAQPDFSSTAPEMLAAAPTDMHILSAVENVPSVILPSPAVVPAALLAEVFSDLERMNEEAVRDLAVLQTSAGLSQAVVGFPEDRFAFRTDAVSWPGWPQVTLPEPADDDALFKLE
jgi:hypothetical protein